MRNALRFVLPALLLTLPCAARAQVQVAGALVQEYTVTPGQNTLEGVLTLSNAGDAPERVSVTLSDVRSDPQAGVVYPKAGTLPRSVAAWVELPGSAVTVPAHGKLAVPYRVKVPQNVGPGTYWSAFLVRPATTSAAPVAGAGGSVRLQQVTQYAVQVVVNVPGGAVHLKFLNPALARAAGGAVLNVDLTNTGERLSTPVTRAEVYDASGALVLKLAGRERRVFPGLSVRETYQISGLKPGRYQVLVIADDGNNDVVGARYNITVE
ncbi:hypothetical protein [Deinococcus maricopensis]|uniref:Uncharacterized protein n=1 Tax=Deinococcus maricopensis (strain DSM 21211 / LMG 22137 / NRRL B-23946 / LB-34) TaxID=709986 RepID=E8U497_DEIML|nr:hypothetical protein [Deinococcus maricopensis]ADV65934.1 hypothetical protein Deima_0271 [Deinococcus maricopensis DSM 21211]